MEFNPLHFTDQNEKLIRLGDIVTATKGKNKGGKFIFVFCIPQHRFGFLYFRSHQEFKKNNDEGLFDENRIPEPFVIDYPHVDFYYTPRTRQEISKID